MHVNSDKTQFCGKPSCPQRTAVGKDNIGFPFAVLSVTFAEPESAFLVKFVH